MSVMDENGKYLITEHQRIYVVYWWQILELHMAAIEDWQTDEADVNLDGRGSFPEVRIYGYSDKGQIFPGQHGVKPVLDFGDRRTPPVQPLYGRSKKTRKPLPRAEYFAAISEWMLREMAGGALFPHDQIEKIFRDPNGVFVTAQELAEMEAPDDFLRSQREKIKRVFGVVVK